MNKPAATKPDHAVREIKEALSTVTVAEAAWCLEQLRLVEQRLERSQPVARELKRIRQRMASSAAVVQRRAETAPRASFDPALPITAHAEEILRAMESHQVLIIAGETGSGKTTQLPKLCLKAGYGTRGQIGCTQPRRIAASAMAQRVAEELNTELGREVGYQVRFRDRSSPQSFIKFMTDGILLAETIRDPDLLSYDAIIIDEAHERSLNIDFLLGYLKTLLPRRPGLKLVITSATIDTEKFSRHFSGAPVIEVSGRGYPVDILYQPFDAEDSGGERSGKNLYQAIGDAVRRLGKLDRQSGQPGDTLVFLSGEREIREASEYLSRQKLSHTEILPLYARLSAAEQRRVFHPGPQRRIILSTNVAETSLTVPRIRYVVDSGLARISRYAHRSRIQRLPIEAISRASANQRSGRCGRLGPGTCIRLYSEEDFKQRPEFTEPEILRTSLGSVILRMLVMGLGSVEAFPFIDPPAPRMINDAYNLLQELNAIDGNRQPTDLGRQLDGWPVDVRLARMVVAGQQMACLEDLLVLVAAMSIQDPRERPLDAQQAADQSHQRFADDKSDFVSLLRLWAYLRDQRRSVSGNRFRKLCGREFLNWQRVLEWFDLYQQLRDQARESGMKLSGVHGEYEQVHQALLCGLLSHIGLKHPEDRSYQGTRSRGFHIFPGSGLFGHTPRWVMAAEIVETSRAWGRTVAAIQPEWIERQGAHLLKRHYHDPHWSRKRGSVMAWEQVSLYGLVIVERRAVDYSRIDAEESRRIFILEALVRGELDTRSGFLQHNRKVREEVELMEHKRRKRDVLADEHAQFEFFDARVPDDVFSSRSFEKWLKQLGEEGRKQLYISHEVLMREDAAAAPQEQFPDVLQVGANRFPLDYRFEPGHPADGVTLRVPLELLNTLDAGKLQWLVPGLLRDKLMALIRGLPKPRRRLLTPVPVFADALHASLQQKAGKPLLDACAEELSRMTGVEFTAFDLDEDALPSHLKFHLQVMGEKNRVVAEGQSLAELQARLGVEAQRRFMDKQGEGYNRDGLLDWNVGALPERLSTEKGREAYPALVDQHTAVGLRLFDTPEEAAASQQSGVLRLLELGLAEKFQFLRKHPGLSPECLMAWSPLGTAQSLVDDLLHSSLLRSAGDVSGIRNESEFKSSLEKVRGQIGLHGRQQADLLNTLIPQYSRIMKALDENWIARQAEAREDMSWQLEDLVYEGFLSHLQPGRLEHYPRYFTAIEERLAGLRANPGRDKQRMDLVAPWWSKYLDYLAHGGLYDQALDQFRWLIEEYRVSLFAQQLGTAEKVSPKRLAAAWQNVS